MTLQLALQEIKDELYRTLPNTFHEAMEQHVNQLQTTGLASGIQVGQKAPDFVLKDHLGRDVALYDELVKGPVLLLFYRGAWCPYCCRQLRAYQELLPQIHAQGAQLIAVSPQTPDNSLSTLEKYNLEYRVLSDLKGIAGAKYNVIFDVPMALRQAYDQVDIDLESYNGSGGFVLPVPSTFMIDETGTVRFAHTNPNFMERLEPAEILYQLSIL